MPIDLEREQAALRRLSISNLQERYAEVFGEPPRSRHRVYLERRILWRVQARAEGGLSERAMRRAAELADDAEARTTAPKRTESPWPRGRRASDRLTPAVLSTLAPIPVTTDPRLPPPGTAISRRYKGKTLIVNVRPDGFEYDGEKFASLSGVAKAITGSHVNGFRFFGLETKA